MDWTAAFPWAAGFFFAGILAGYAIRAFHSARRRARARRFR